jgi:hypothetical protein
LHTPEQQSAFAAQLSSTMAHSLFVQTPPKHPSEQQSCAVAQGTASARHASRHWMTPAWPVTGSHSPLQHWGLCMQLALGARHDPPLAPFPGVADMLPTQLPPLHVPEQQSNPWVQALAEAPHVAAVPTLPGVGPPQTLDRHAPAQQSESAKHPAPAVRHALPSPK